MRVQQIPRKVNNIIEFAANIFKYFFIIIILFLSDSFSEIFPIKISLSAADILYDYRQHKEISLSLVSCRYLLLTGRKPPPPETSFGEKVREGFVVSCGYVQTATIAVSRVIPLPTFVVACRAFIVRSNSYRFRATADDFLLSASPFRESRNSYVRSG